MHQNVFLFYSNGFEVVLLFVKISYFSAKAVIVTFIVSISSQSKLSMNKHKKCFVFFWFVFRNNNISDQDIFTIKDNEFTHI